MHIGVLAKADAHILFTEHPNANAVNPVYEIGNWIILFFCRYNVILNVSNY